MTIEEITTSPMIGETVIDKTIEETILEIDKIKGETTPKRDIEIQVRVRRVKKLP